MMELFCGPLWEFYDTQGPALLGTILMTLVTTNIICFMVYRHWKEKCLRIEKQGRFITEFPEGIEKAPKE